MNAYVNGDFNTSNQRRGEYHIAAELIQGFRFHGELTAEGSALMRSLCHLICPGLMASDRDRQRWVKLCGQIREALPPKYVGETDGEVHVRINAIAYQWLAAQGVADTDRDGE